MRTILTAALLLTAPPASAEWMEWALPCASRAEKLAYLEATGHRLHVTGNPGPRGTPEIYLTDGGAWTVMVTDDDGMTCTVLYGMGWNEAGQ